MSKKAKSATYHFICDKCPEGVQLLVIREMQSGLVKVEAKPCTSCRENYGVHALLKGKLPRLNEALGKEVPRPYYIDTSHVG